MATSRDREVAVDRACPLPCDELAVGDEVAMRLYPQSPMSRGAWCALACLLCACGTEPVEQGGSAPSVDATGVGDALEDVAASDTATVDAGALMTDLGGALDASRSQDTAACLEGAKKCNDKSPYAVDVCANGGWVTEICATGDEVCANGSCVQAMCAVGQKFCDGNKSMQCASDGLASHLLDDCAAVGKKCLQGICDVESCAPGQSKCEGAQLATCHANGKGFKITACEAGKVCDAGQCKATVCLPSETYCEGSVVIACNAKRTGFAKIADCAAKSLTCCDGACGKSICAPKSTKCDGGAAVTCNSCGSAWGSLVDCKSKGQVCLDGSCLPQVCTPGALACSGNKVAQKCDGVGLKWLASACQPGLFCHGGVCKKPTCALPAKWGPSTQSFRTWSVATKAADACDLDGDGTKDNAFGGSIGPFASQMNAGLAAQVKAGTGVFLLDTASWVTDGSQFDLDVLNGSVDPTKGPCDPASQSCQFVAFVTSYDMQSKSSQCPAKTVLEGATVANGKLTSLGPAGKPFQVVLPLGTGADLHLDFHKLRVQGDVTGTSTWKTTANGKMCGAIRKDQLLKELDKVPDWFFSQQGLNKATVKLLLNQLMKLDFDTDGDGKKDAASAALNFTTGPATISGF